MEILKLKETFNLAFNYQPKPLGTPKPDERGKTGLEPFSIGDTKLL